MLKINAMEVIWETTEKERKQFEQEFLDLIKGYTQYVISPISWYSGQRKPILNEEFVNQLPKDIREDIERLISKL